MLINEIFTYNQHFVAMMNIINAARLNPPKEGHKHHIIPKCWFKMNNLPIDNSVDNLVLLTYEDHCKIHKLMYLCIKGNTMKSKMAFAAHILNKCGTFPGLYLTEEHRQKLSEAHKGIPGYWKGKKLYDDTKIKLSKAHKGKKLSAEHKLKIGEAHKGRKTSLKGKTWELINGKRV